ncbi:MAG: aldehyde dehydrogenase family protein, partial [Anaerolineae bacterium]|nr:aldehyde dehydrogenase family protein [Anaerolineae bacterium]
RHEAGELFFAPTILGNVTQQMAIANQEIFGPVAPVIRFKDEAEAVAIANSIDNRWSQAAIQMNVTFAHLERAEFAAALNRVEAADQIWQAANPLTPIWTTATKAAILAELGAVAAAAELVTTITVPDIEFPDHFRITETLAILNRYIEVKQGNRPTEQKELQELARQISRLSPLAPPSIPYTANLGFTILFACEAYDLLIDVTDQFIQRYDAAGAKGYHICLPPSSLEARPP